MTDPDNVPDPRGRNNSLLGHIKTNEIFQEPELRRLSKDVVSMIAKTKHHVEDEALKYSGPVLFSKRMKLTRV